MTESQDNLCVYCLDRPGTTDDHVPPALIFPKPRPSDLVTVPACAECNSSFEKDEEYVRSLFRFGDGGLSEAMVDLGPRIDRHLKRSPGFRSILGRQVQRVNMITPENLWIGQRLAIKTDWSRIAELVVKLVRGLYYFEFGTALPISSFVEMPECHAEHSDLSMPHSMTRRGKRSWPGVFEYKCNRIEDQPEGSVWMFRFYGKHVLMAFTGRAEDKDIRKAVQNNSVDHYN